MGQKVHPIGLRLGKFLRWDSEWYGKQKTNLSKFVFQTYQIKNLLNFYLFKKELLVHSFCLKYIDNTFFLVISIIPVFNQYKFISINFLKNYYKKFLPKRNFLRKISFCLFSNSNKLKTTIFLKLWNQFLFLKKSQLKYSFIPSYNIENFFKNFYKLRYLDLNQPLFINDCQNISKSLLMFQNLPKIVVIIKNLTKCSYFSDTFAQKIVRDKNYNRWFYYFYIMFKTKPSALLISLVIKKALEDRFQRKKQRFLLNNLRQFLVTFKDKKFFNKIQGIKIQIKGKMNGRNRSALSRIQVGSIPLSTISHSIDYSFIPALTLYGSFGIKVWIATKKF